MTRSSIRMEPQRTRRGSAMRRPAAVSTRASIAAMGNRALRRYVDAVAVQRLYLGNKPQWDTDTAVPATKVAGVSLGKGKRGTDLKAIDTALAAYGAVAGGATRPQQLATLKAAITIWIAGKAGKSSQRRGTVLSLEQEVDDKIAYFGVGSFKYRNPPLAETDGRALIARIDNRDATALNGLLGSTIQYGPFEDFTAPWEHEWGLGVDRITDEAYLIPGDATGVTWTAHSPYVHELAHSHPYFTDPGEPLGRDRRGAVGVKTKEIATHNGQVGMVLWADLISGAENKEMLKIFPSGSDVDFAAKKGIPSHSVYTTYRVDTPAVHVGNPTAAIANSSQLSFEIVNATMTGAPKISTCTMRALADGAIFWTRHNVRGDMTHGGAGLLNL